MRKLKQQIENRSWPISTGPVVVFAYQNIFTKDMITNLIRKSAGNRDGPLIFHMRDGPPNVTGTPGGTGPPLNVSGSGPPKTTGPPMEWLVRKKTLKRS